MVLVANWNIYENFKSSEFVCKCGCGTLSIAKTLVDRLQKARLIARKKIREITKNPNADLPFTINSGCRCVSHNTNVKGRPNSDHIASRSGELVCVGVDIKVRGDRERFVVYDSLREAGFTRFDVRRGYIHTGLDMSQGGRNDSHVLCVGV